MNETLYIEGATGLVERLSRIESIIEALELRQIAAIGNSDIEEYSLNDGQIQIRTLYKSAESIAKAIIAYERIKQSILNKLNGRGMVLRPWQGLF
jgi:hypothetical protein